MASVKRTLNAGHVGFIIKRRHGARLPRGALRFSLMCSLSQEDFKKRSRQGVSWLESIDQGDLVECSEACALVSTGLRDRAAQYPSEEERCRAGAEAGPIVGQHAWREHALRMCSVLVEGECSLLQCAMQRFQKNSSKP